MGFRESSNIDFKSMNLKKNVSYEEAIKMDNRNQTDPHMNAREFLAKIEDGTLKASINIPECNYEKFKENVLVGKYDN